MVPPLRWKRRKRSVREEPMSSTCPAGVWAIVGSLLLVFAGTST